MPCYRDQQQLDKDIVPKLLPSIAGHCCFQDKETSLIQRGPTRLASASPSGSNGDDRRQWRKQGGAVGAAASRMRAAAKQTLGAATRAVSLRSNDGEGKPAGGSRSGFPSYNLSVSLRSTAPLVGEPLAKPFTLLGLPKPLLQGEVARRRRDGEVVQRRACPL